jgi:Lon protease-like protein
LIQSGPEVGGPAIPHRVGTTAQIVTVKRLPDGRMNLIAVGQQRFRTIETVRTEPYLIARVEAFTDTEPDAAAVPMAAEVRASLATYLRNLFAILDQPQEELELPSEPGRLSLVAAAVLQIPLSERQALLEMTDVAARLQQEREWLAREMEKQKTLPRIKKRLGDATPVDTSQLMGRVSLN